MATIYSCLQHMNIKASEVCKIMYSLEVHLSTLVIFYCSLIRQKPSHAKIKKNSLPVYSFFLRLYARFDVTGGWSVSPCTKLLRYISNGCQSSPRLDGMPAAIRRSRKVKLPKLINIFNAWFTQQKGQHLETDHNHFLPITS